MVEKISHIEFWGSHFGLYMVQPGVCVNLKSLSNTHSRSASIIKVKNICFEDKDMTSVFNFLEERFLS